MVEENLVPYPSLAMEFRGVFLDRDTPAIKEAIVPQGRAEDAAAQKVNLAPLNVIARVDGFLILSTHNDKI